MPSTTTRIITIALATLALAAPVATAKPVSDYGSYGGTHPSSVAGTDAAPTQDLRNADRRVQATPAQQPQTMKPVVLTKHEPVAADDDGVSPFVYIVPGLVLVAMLAAGFGYTRLSRLPARA
jgi:hypothetical protein